MTDKIILELTPQEANLVRAVIREWRLDYGPQIDTLQARINLLPIEDRLYDALALRPYSYKGLRD